MSNSNPPSNAVDITTIPTQQLSQLQSRLSQELEHLTNSHSRLRAAQTQFRDCIRSIKDGVKEKGKGTQLLIPLTNSLYVPGTLSSNTHVLVDVGTGFYVEKTTEDATKFYEGKIKDLDKNLAEVEKAVGGKSESLRTIEEVLRQKVVTEQAEQSQTSKQTQGAG